MERMADAASRNGVELCLPTDAELSQGGHAEQGGQLLPLPEKGGHVSRQAYAMITQAPAEEMAEAVFRIDTLIDTGADTRILSQRALEPGFCSRRSCTHGVRGVGGARDNGEVVTVYVAVAGLARAWLADYSISRERRERGRREF